MSIKTRLTIVSGFYILVIIALSLFAYRGAENLSNSIEKLATVQLPSVKNMTLMDMMHDGLRAIVYRSLFVSSTNDIKEKKEILQELNKFTKSFREYYASLKDLPLTAETKKELKEIEPSIEKYVNSAADVTQLALTFQEQDVKKAIAQLPEFNIVFKELEEKMEGIETRIDKEASVFDDDGKEIQRNITIMGVFGSALGLIISIFLVLVIGKTLASIYNNVETVSLGIKSAADKVSTTSQQLAASSQEQASSIEETSSSLEEISGMVAASVKGAEHSMETSKRVSHLISEGSISMASLQLAVNEISETNKRIEKLGQLITEIGEKTELIDEIVFQTRLLSFNASVEAERAGEHGRGFAVVAQEVGNLAQMSGKSASEIVLIVKKSIKEAHEVVELNRAKTSQGVSLCQKTFEHLKMIESASKEIIDGSENILRNSVEQSAGVSEINQSIQLLTKTTQENSSLAQMTADEVLNLDAQSGNLSLALSELSVLAIGKDKKESPVSMTPPLSAPATTTIKPQLKSKSYDHQKPVRTQRKPQFSSVGNLAIKTSDDPWEKL